MGNSAEPFTDFTLLDNGKFKYKNGRISNYSLEDVKYIEHRLSTENISVYKLAEELGMTYSHLNRIRHTILNGGYDEWLNSESVIDDLEFNSPTIHIEKIEINNNYYNTSNNEPIKKSTNNKVNQSALAKWSKRVRERDNYTCAVCDTYNKKNMEAHHIKPKSLYPNEALDDLNGVAICQKCHHKYNSRYEVKNQNPVTWTRFLSDERRGY